MRLPTCPVTQMRLIFLPAIFLAMTVFVFSGCGKKQPAAASASVLAETNTTSVSSQPVEGQTDAFLTQQLRAFMQEKGRFPTDFAELVRTKLDSRPRVPPGMKWVIDTTTQEVKLVKQ